MIEDGTAGGGLESVNLREDSLRLLEFHLVRKRLAESTTFLLARGMALELMPCYEPTEVGRLQQETSEARRFLESGSTLDLSDVKDLRQALQRAAVGGLLAGEELRQVHDTLRATRRARVAVLRHKDVPTLEAMAEDLPVLRDLEVELAGSIGPSGEVQDSATPTLKQLRTESRAAYKRLMDSLERAVRRLQRQHILQESVITQRNGRMVLLVKTEMKHRLQGIVHDVSDSGATLFVEPMAAIGPGNLWRELCLAEEREVEKVLRSLSSQVETHSEDILGGLHLLAELDLAMAKARYSIAIKGIPLTLLQGERQLMSLIEARHPLLEGEVVPITVEIGDGWSILLITGPNAGGKTVALKTIGLIILMAQAGLHVPAANATFILFDGLYADIGDQQSIQRSLSTFSSHILNLRAILNQATDKSFVLIDELGTSTDPEEGAALAKAILQAFSQRGVTLVATTHQRDVASFVQEQPDMMNASVELHPRTLSPTYRLTVGLPGRSYALTIASRLGLDWEIVDRARGLLSPDHQRAESLLRELQEERHLAEERRRVAEEALARAERKDSQLEEKLGTIEDKKTEMIEESRLQFQRRVDEMTKRLRDMEREIAQPVHPAAFREARKELAQVRRELRSTEWQPLAGKRADWLKCLKAGDRVYLRGVPQPVEVITPPNDDGTVEVLLGSMRARLQSYQLERPAGPETKPFRDQIFISRTARKRVDPELDLHGLRVEVALEQVEAYLNDATLAGMSSVRVMHGMGTGALRNAVRGYLSSHPLVKTVRTDASKSNDSVTIVELT